MALARSPLDSAPPQDLQPARRCIRTADSDFDRLFDLRTPVKATELDCSRACAEAPSTWCVGYQFDNSSEASSTCTLFDDCSKAREDSAVRLSRSRVQWNGAGFRPYSPEQQQRIERLTGRSHLWGHPAYKCPSQIEDAGYPTDATCARCVQHNSAKANCCSPGGAWEGHCDEQESQHSWSEGYRACNSSLVVPVKVREGRPVLYNHLHKAGGTTVCELAKRNGEKLSQNNSNCNMVPDDNWEGGVAADPSMWPPTTSVECAQRQQLVRDHSLTWMSQERWVDLEHCDDFYHAITLRDPLDRIVSNFMHTRFRAKMHPDQIGAQTSRHNSMNVSADDVMACVFPGANCYHRRFYIEVRPAPCPLSPCTAHAQRHSAPAPSTQLHHMPTNSAVVDWGLRQLLRTHACRTQGVFPTRRCADAQALGGRKGCAAAFRRDHDARRSRRGQRTGAATTDSRLPPQTAVCHAPSPPARANVSLTTCARQMRDLLGWNVTSTPATDEIENTREGHFATVGEAVDPLPFSDGQLRQLFEVNQLDYELLCYAQALRASRLAALAKSSEDEQNNQQEHRKQQNRKQKNHGKQHRKQNTQNRFDSDGGGTAPVGFQKREP